MTIRSDKQKPGRKLPGLIFRLRLYHSCPKAYDDLTGDSDKEYKPKVKGKKSKVN